MHLFITIQKLQTIIIKLTCTHKKREGKPASHNFTNILTNKNQQAKDAAFNRSDRYFRGLRMKLPPVERFCKLPYVCIGGKLGIK